MNRGLPLERGALVHRARVVGQRVVHGVREEARVLARCPRAQLEHAIALDGGQAEAKVGPAQERPEPRLERVEARAGDDRLLVDQVALEARQHFLIRHVQRAEHREAAEPDAARREDGGERLEVAGAGLEAGAHVRGECGQGPRRLDVDEAPLESDLEVPIEPRLPILDGEDDGVVHRKRDPIDPGQREGIGVQEPEPRNGLLVDAQAPLELSVGARQVALERGGRVEAPELERDQRRGMVLLPRDRRKHGGHQGIDELVVSREHREVIDGTRQLGRPAHLLLEVTGEASADRLLGGNRLLPERDERAEAQLALEGECPAQRGQRREQFR